MKITLLINDKETTFVAPFISTRKLKETFKLSQKIQEGFSEEIFDELAQFVVSIYGKQFTLDQLLDGLPANQFLTKVIDDIQNIVGQFDVKVKN